MNAACLLLALAVAAGEGPKVKVGSKGNTESIVLGEMAVLLAQTAGARVDHEASLGGTGVVWKALLNGDIDVYPEYTGTLSEEIFSGEDLPDMAALEARLAGLGIRMTGPLGFNNSYALGVPETLAEKLNLRTISDLKSHPELKFAFSSEFKERGDGWPRLKERYRLPQTKIISMEHATAYRALNAGDAQVTDAYTTDPNIERFSLRLLTDDLGHFPKYEALFVYRVDLQQRAPQVVAALKRLEGSISDEKMLALNGQVEFEKKSKQEVATAFLNEHFDLKLTPKKDWGLWQRLLETTLQHLLLVGVSLAGAIVVSVPLGVMAAKNKLAGQIILGTTEIIQTIPGLALLVMLSTVFDPLGLPTIGPLPAIVALFLYSLLPIVRNTMTGLTDVPAALKESAQALGLTPLARLRLIEIPLASRLILAGIKTTAVINVGFAALGGLIGAGGYGATIKTGLDLSDPRIMLEGAIPAAVLALLVKGIFELAERFVVPKGLRIAAAR